MFVCRFEILADPLRKQWRTEAIDRAIGICHCTDAAPLSSTILPCQVSDADGLNVLRNRKPLFARIDDEPRFRIHVGTGMMKSPL